MTQDALDGLYKEFLSMNVPISFAGDLPSFRLGAAEFGNFVRERVELKADDPPKEPDNDA